MAAVGRAVLEEQGNSLHDQFRGGVSDGGEYFRFDIAEDFDELDVEQQRMTLSSWDKSVKI